MRKIFWSFNKKAYEIQSGIHKWKNFACSYNGNVEMYKVKTKFLRFVPEKTQLKQ